MRHGDYHDESRYRGPLVSEVFVCQDGPFSDFSMVDAYHYGRLATGCYKGLWVRLRASPVKMGLIGETARP